jgi:hypothetical protein
MTWQEAKIVLDSLASTERDHEWASGDDTLGSDVNHALLQHTFHEEGTLKLEGLLYQPSPAPANGYPNITNAPTTAPTHASTMAEQPAVGLLSTVFLPRNCSYDNFLPDEEQVCSDASPFGSSVDLNTTRGRILTVHALKRARWEYFIGRRLWCVYPEECDYKKGGMFKRIPVRTFFFDGYTDPFHVIQTQKELAKQSPSAKFSCQTKRLYADLNKNLVGANEWEAGLFAGAITSLDNRVS